MGNYNKIREAMKKIKRLAVKYQRQAENDCNGRGWLNGKFYTLAALDAYECRTYPGVLDGHNMPGDLDSGKNVFTRAIDRYADDIKKLVPRGFRVEFQGDPRGACVKLFDEAGQYVEL